MYETISILLEKHFSVDWSTRAVLGQFTYELFSTKIAHQLYSVLIESKDTKTVYTLIYSHYTLSHFNELYNGVYYIVINILPPRTEINELGLYTKIMSLGVYIYKIFDYISQCPGIHDRTDRMLMAENSCYLFIGDFQSTLWPFNQLTE